MLSQQQPDGTEKPVFYAAKKLDETQANYSAFKGELLAVLTFIKQFKYYLAPFPFLLRTDNRALSHLYSIEAPNPMFSRYLETLANYNFEVQHREGTKHGNADALSRISHAQAPTADMRELGQNEDFLLAYVEQFHEETAQSRFQHSRADIASEQQRDPELTEVIKAVQAQKPLDTIQVLAAAPVTKVYLSMLPSLSVREGVLSMKIITLRAGREIERWVLIVPRNFWYAVLRDVHEMIGHKAVEATVEQAQRYFFFPNMKTHVERLIKSCHDCNEKDSAPTPQRGTYLNASAAGYPFQRLSVDIVGPLPRSRQGHEYILTCKCPFTRWVEAFPLSNTGTQGICRKLEEHILSRFGVPENIHSDRGSGFTADMLRDVCLALQIHKSDTPAYHPASNSVERAHADLGKMLTALTKNKPHLWEDYLPAALFAIRITRNRHTGLTPYEMVFGRDPVTPLDLIFSLPQPHPLYRSQQTYATELRRRIAEAHQFARAHIGQAVKRQRASYQGHIKEYLPGQKVWLFTPKYRVRQRRKFQRRWTGPWTVEKKLNPATYIIAPDPQWQRQKTELVTIDRLKPYYELETDQSAPPPADADLSMPGDEFAENFDVDLIDEENLPVEPAPNEEEEGPMEAPQAQDLAEPIRPIPAPRAPRQPDPEPHYFNAEPLRDEMYEEIDETPPRPRFRPVPDFDVTPVTPRRSPRLMPRNMREQRRLEEERRQRDLRENTQRQQRLQRWQRRQRNTLDDRIDEAFRNSSLIADINALLISDMRNRQFSK